MDFENKNIVMADRFEIQNLEDVGAHFFKHILNMDIDEIFISDESLLADFIGCGMPDNIEADTLEAYCNAWDDWVLEKIKDVYQIKIESPNITLVDLFNLIEQKYEN